MAKIKSYMNPNIPKPKPGDSSGEALIKPPRYVGKPVLVGERKKRRTPPGITGPEKREKRPLPNPINKSPEKREKRSLPKPINKSGLRKDGPIGKKGSISMSVKKPLLISRKKIGGR